MKPAQHHPEVAAIAFPCARAVCRKNASIGHDECATPIKTFFYAVDFVPDFRMIVDMSRPGWTKNL